VSPVVNLGLAFRKMSTSIRGDGSTVHYGGPSPWRGADRSSSSRFRDTTDHARCASIVRGYHSFHLSKGWAGLAYSSAVCPHGTRFEGRGPAYRTGANGTNDGNLRSYATVYLAGEGDPLTDEAKTAFLEEGRRLAPLRWAHSDWKATGCPGAPLRSWKALGFPASGATPAPAPSRPSTTGARVTVNVSLPLLRSGNGGSHVAALQSLLNVKAAQALTVDGDFGPATETGVRNVQRFFGLPVDGIAGEKTWTVLLAFPL